MELLRPRLFKTEGKIIIQTSGDFEYTDPTFNTKMNKRISLLSIGEFGYNNPPPVEVDMSNPAEEKLVLYAGMQSLIKSCVDNAEDIKSTLHQLYIGKTKPQSEEEKKEALKIDFMKLRDWYMDDIRSSKIYQEFSITYNSTKKLKPFSKLFHDFVMDRNIYTHGTLCFVKPNFDFVILYIDSASNGQKYATIDLNILKSYNDCYVKIKEFMREYTGIHQERLRISNEHKNK